MENKGISMKVNGFWYIYCKLVSGKIMYDSCSFIRMVIISMLTLPLWIFPGLILNAIIYRRTKDEKNVFKYWVWIIFNAIAILLGSMMFAIDTGRYPNAVIEFIFSWLTFWIIIGGFILGVIILLYIIDLIYKFVSLHFIKHINIEKFKNKKLTEFIKSMKEKYCFPILWE